MEEVQGYKHWGISGVKFYDTMQLANNGEKIRVIDVSINNA